MFLTAEMGRFAPIAMTLLADLYYTSSIVLMVVCIAVGNAKPTNNFSWSAQRPLSHARYMHGHRGESKPQWSVLRPSPPRV